MNSTRFYKIVIVVLLVTNIGMIAFMLIMRGIVVPGMIRGKAPDYLVRELKMTGEQLGHFRGMRDQHRREMVRLRHRDRLLHERFFDQLFRNPPDTARIMQLADSIAITRKQMELLTFDHFRRLQLVLDNHQQEKFRQVFHTALDRVMPPAPEAPPPPPPPPVHR